MKHNNLFSQCSLTIIAILLTFITITKCLAVDDNRQPEFTVNHQDKSLTTANKQMIVAAHPIASQIGLNILRNGGNAIDAMIATQLVLNVVEPQSSGIGGGAFLLYYDATEKKLASFDARETAPSLANENLFLDENGKAQSFKQASHNGNAVGVPGLLKLLEHVHNKYGQLPWENLCEPAINLANEGYPVSSRLAGILAYSKANPYFYKANKLVKKGDILTDKDFAKTLKNIQKNGSTQFYHGNIAENIVAAIKKNNGILSTIDLNNYEIKQREPVCFTYRNHKVCSMGPP
ncbi:MAG: gamma-glutamyltransferase, partial [Nocardioidaceae bacterium]|nr:gamma-glutamyltransferase [Nocardioidaceae bacterium]